MSSPTLQSYNHTHPHAHHNTDKARPTTPKSQTHRLSLSSPVSHLTTLTHAPAVFLGTIHRHERELVINHQARNAKKEANAAIDKYEAGFSSSSTITSPSSSISSDSSSKGTSGAARAAMGAGASSEDEAEWAAIVAARAAATRRSATQDLELRMAEERRESILREVETHRLSLSSPVSHLTTLTHAPAVFLGTIHRHERELVINHQARNAKKEANAAIDKYEAGFSSSSTITSPSSSISSDSSSKGTSGAARAAMGAGASSEDEAEWAAIVAARAAATRRSATQDLELRMAEERRESILREVEMEGKGEF